MAKRDSKDQTHQVNMRFDHFINRVLWDSDKRTGRVWAGGMGLCFAWSTRNGGYYAAFAHGDHTRVYRAMKPRGIAKPAA